jgi:hypothetical protein
MAHLVSNSYAEHMALEGFYEGIIDAADEFFECYQGIYTEMKLSDFPVVRIAAGAPIEVLTDLRTWIVTNREDACEAPGDPDKDDEAGEEADDIDCTELGNLIDNILSVVDRALYKLRFLK